jgi:hypothetical protein
MSAPVVIGGLMSEAWARFISSHVRAVEYYNMRVRAATQPAIFPIDIFSQEISMKFVLMMASTYIAVTTVLYFGMQRFHRGLCLQWLTIAYNTANVVISFYVAASSTCPSSRNE